MGTTECGHSTETIVHIANHMMSQRKFHVVNDHKRDSKHPPIDLFGLAVVIFAVVNLSTNMIMTIIYTPLAKNYGVYLPAGLRVVVPAAVIVVVYPRLVMPIVSTKFQQPFSAGAIISQAVGGVFLLPPLALLTEIALIFLLQLLAVGLILGGLVEWGTQISSYGILLIMVTTTLAAVLGVWCSVVLYWLRQTYRSWGRGTGT
jgi:hypothetical protein